MVNIARLAAAEPNAGTGYETYAIEAVIIGGASFFGGVGKIPKVIIGGLIIGVINNGLNMVGVSSYYQQLAMGCLLILAVTLGPFLWRQPQELTACFHHSKEVYFYEA